MSDLAFGIILGVVVTSVVIGAIRESSATGGTVEREETPAGEPEGRTVYALLLAHNMHALRHPEEYAFRLARHDREGRRISTSVPTLDTKVGRGQWLYIIPLLRAEN